MGLLDKFATVQIESDRRISEEDRAFCLRHQEAFDKSGPALQRIADAMIAADAEQDAIFSGFKGGSDYLSSMRGFSNNVQDVYTTMKSRNSEFISTIVSYFAQRYKVELDAREIEEHLIPESPAEPELPGRGYRDTTAEEREEYKMKMAEYKKDHEEWDVSLRTLPLRYEQIVDEIFTQLGGFSFEEQAMNEFLERTWNATHYLSNYSWNNIKAGQEKFEIKGTVLRIGNGCQCNDYSYMRHPVPEYTPNSDLITLLDAVAWYECGRIGEGPFWFPTLGTRYTYTKERVTYTQNMTKVESITCYKNGRVDIRFRDAAYLQEFAEQCLRNRPSSMDQ